MTKTIRGAKKWRLVEVNLKDTFSWVHEIPGRLNKRCVYYAIKCVHTYLTLAGDFHFLWECLRVIFAIFWGTPGHPGSLCSIREYINWKQVNRSATVFSVSDEFIMHAFKGHLVVSICTQLKIASPKNAIQHEPGLEWLKNTAESIVKSTLLPRDSEDSVLNLSST